MGRRSAFRNTEEGDLQGASGVLWTLAVPSSCWYGVRDSTLTFLPFFYHFSLLLFFVSWPSVAECCVHRPLPSKAVPLIYLGQVCWSEGPVPKCGIYTRHLYKVATVICTPSGPASPYVSGPYNAGLYFAKTEGTISTKVTVIPAILTEGWLCAEQCVG